MSEPRTVRLMTLGLVVAGLLSGCATFAKCGVEGCPGDAQITAKVSALLNEHPELGTSITVQTLDHVVYLNGLVSTPLASDIAKSVALEVPGVTRVENSIVSEN